ncbi:DUF805 domain-containing protein [Hyphomonas oceanitis]|uniref:DUF805 domain-containing protein n=1 Tax=Hyphomonas oceanitis TaxID=81033 RepID=UPI0030030A68
MSFADVLFKPSGRITQSQFWAGWGTLLAVNLIANFIPVLNLLVPLAMLYVGFCVYGKRLHDMNKSALWHLFIVLFTFVALIVGFILSWPIISSLMDANPDIMQSDPAGVGYALAPLGSASFICFVVWIVFTIWVGIAKSTPGANKFGPPSGGPSEETFA